MQGFYDCVFRLLDLVEASEIVARHGIRQDDFTSPRKTISEKVDMRDNVNALFVQDCSSINARQHKVNCCENWHTTHQA